MVHSTLLCIELKILKNVVKSSFLSDNNLVSFFLYIVILIWLTKKYRNEIQQILFVLILLYMTI